jgi:hypothetical protein
MTDTSLLPKRINDIRPKRSHHCKIVMDEDGIKATGSSLFPQSCPINNQPFKCYGRADLARWRVGRGRRLYAAQHRGRCACDTTFDVSKGARVMLAKALLAQLQVIIFD